MDGKILGEGFGCHDTFKEVFDKLVKSYALDAGQPGCFGNPFRQTKARRFIESTLKSKGETSLLLDWNKHHI
ncbi:MAG: hypothetical protein SRB2_02106 [Desulfobacteraceae bacterium Eth-SRB2]|nr:MAG: hypothetical protein SRB2_02106 [Desulfobacteraceae bacterium Eth-SRB2]